MADGWGDEAKGEEKGESKDDDIVKKVSKFFYENDEFFRVFEDFVQSNADRIDLTSDENKLEYTEIYEAWQALLEEQITGFIESEGSTVGEFYSRVREAQEENPFSAEATLGTIMRATADFDIFIKVMRETAEEMEQGGLHRK